MGKRGVIGVDIGGTTVKLGFFDMGGNLLKKWEIVTRRGNNGARIMPDIAESIKSAVSGIGLTPDDIAGIGGGFPAPVQPDGYVGICPNLGGLQELNPGQTLSSLLGGIPVKITNDANVAALGEMWKGGGAGYKDMVMVTLGTGIGGGVVVDGRIVSGMQGVSGEIGHIHAYEGETEACNCGGHGCLEQAASATGFVRFAKRRLSTDSRQSALRNCPQLTAKALFDAAKAGDEVALESVEESCRVLGRVLGMISMVLDPEVYLIGGGVSKAGRFLIERIQKYHDIYSPIAARKAAVRLATLGNDAGIYGGAKLALD